MLTAMGDVMRRAYEKGWRSLEHLLKLANELSHTEYGHYLLDRYQNK